MESRIDREEVSRFSFLVADPVAFVDDVESVTGADPFGRLRGLLDPFRNDRVAGLPPFQGGVVGLLGYELGAAWETEPRPTYDEFALPVLAAGGYARVLCDGVESDAGSGHMSIGLKPGDTVEVRVAFEGATPAPGCPALTYCSPP